MIKLKPFVADDLNKLDMLVKESHIDKAKKNQIVKSKSYLKSRYNDYEKSLPWKIKKSSCKPDLKTCLEGLYNSPPNCLSYIDETRKKISPKCCSICGSTHVSEVDHYLPQKKFPEYSIYSRNLIPACNCNKRKSQKVADSKGGRFIHPYIDKFQDKRLFVGKILWDGNIPKLEIIVHSKDKSILPILNFQLDKVILKTNILKTSESFLGDMIVNPFGFFNLNKDSAYDRNDLKSDLNNWLIQTDNKSRSKNNWESMLLFGVLNSTRVQKMILSNM